MEDALGSCQLLEYFDRSVVDYCDDWVQWSIPRIVPVNQQILNCWEYHHCGFEKGGKNAELHGVCPAYPKHGHTCAYLRAAKPTRKAEGTARSLLCTSPLDCVRCDFFNSGHHEKLILDRDISWTIPWQRKAAFEEINGVEEDYGVLAAIDEIHLS